MCSTHLITVVALESVNLKRATKFVFRLMALALKRKKEIRKTLGVCRIAEEAK